MNKCLKINFCKIIIWAVMTMVLVACDNEVHRNEWVEKDNKEYYYSESGKKIKNSIYKINGELYYFDGNGVKVKNDFVNYDGNEYYFDMIGKVTKGWKEIGNNWYLFDKNDGKMLKGWQHDGNDWYYLENGGIMQKQKWIDTIYYVDSSGKMCKNGWFNINGKKCYFDLEGKYQKNMKAEIVFLGIPFQDYLNSWFSYSINKNVTVYGNITKAYLKDGEIIIEGNVSADGSKEYTGIVEPTIYYELKDSEGYTIFENSCSLDACMAGYKFKKSLLSTSRLDEGETYYFSIQTIANRRMWR